MKRVACCAVLLLPLLLTACGGSSDDGDLSTKPLKTPAAAKTPAAKPTTEAPAAEVPAAEVPAAEGNPVDGEAFCAFLKQTAPQLKAAGSAPGAEASFAIELANWIGEHPEQKPRTADDLDAASQESCPDTRTEVVATMGATSFADALS